ncbi:hypothetical protein [Erwinia sp. E_sp_B04_7]|uniref:hypothetical protein n=1 Tax=unclassified Erwinia TaxID=2622719 RepID=UPI0030CDBBC7
MSQLLGIDAGNTMIKAVLFDLDGTVRAVASCAGKPTSPGQDTLNAPSPRSGRA